MKKPTALLLSFLVPSISYAVGYNYIYNQDSGYYDFVHSSSTLPLGATHYINNSGDDQSGQFNISSGTFRGKIVIKDDDSDNSDTYFDLVGDDLFLYVHGSLRQTWTTTTAATFLLLEGGDFVLLENGDQIILE